MRERRGKDIHALRVHTHTHTLNVVGETDRHTETETDRVGDKERDNRREIKRARDKAGEIWRGR